MAGVDDFGEFKKLFDDMVGDLDGKHRAALLKFLDMQRSLVEQHQRYVDGELSRDNEALKNFARFMMSSYTQVLGLQREHRTYVRDVHATISDAHLQLIDKLKTHLSTPGSAPEPEPPGKGGTTKKRTRRSKGKSRER